MWLLGEQVSQVGEPIAKCDSAVSDAKVVERELRTSTRQYSLRVGGCPHGRQAMMTARSASIRGPKIPAICYEMTVLYRSSTRPEVPAAPLCHPSRAPSPLMQHSRCPRARPSGRTVGRPAWGWPTSCSTPSKPAGNGSTATRSSALTLRSSTGNCRKGTTTNGSLRVRRLGQLMAMIDDLLYLASCGKKSPGTAGCKTLLNHARVRSWPIRTLHRINVGDVGLLREVPLDNMQWRKL